MIVPSTAVRRGGLVSAHQLAQQLEEGQAQRARRYARLSALRAQHLQLHSLGSRAHPRRYRRPMSRAAPRGHPGGWPAPHPVHAARHSPLATRARTRALTRRRAETRVPHTLAPPARRAHPTPILIMPPPRCCRLFSVFTPNKTDSHGENLKT
ncbi:unnamed protein product [Spodoptera exigua]|nr:unnamed protein product [Spodoptera exigua]